MAKTQAPRSTELQTLVRWERPSRGDDFTRLPDRYEFMGHVRVKLSPAGGREVIRADRLEALNNYEVWARYGGFRPEDRLVEENGDRMWYITAVQDFEERHRWVQMEAVLRWK